MHIAKLIPGQPKKCQNYGTESQGLPGLAMPQRQQSEYPVFQHRETHVHSIILRDQHVRPDPHLMACVATSRRPPGRPRSARIGGFDIPDGQTNAGAA